MRTTLSLKNVTKRFKASHPQGGDAYAVDGVDLEVGEGEFVTMVGPRNSGKSTLLRLIAGLEAPTSGHVYINDCNVSSIPARARNVGVLFQDHALFSHMTVAENIGFGLKIRKVSGKERRSRVEELVELMGLEGLEARKPAELSPGQQHRLALSRALGPGPEVLLMDEPFRSVDAKLRQRLKSDTKRWQQELKITTILVTHDHRDALELGDRVAVMNLGRIEQIDAPHTVYNYPATEFVARLLGKADGLTQSVHADVTF